MAGAKGRRTEPRGDGEQPKTAARRQTPAPEKGRPPPFAGAGPTEAEPASGFPSGRRLVEKLSANLRRNWLRRRDLRARDLSPAASDLLGRWSEAEARLQLADDRALFGDRWALASQNSAARLAAQLESAVVVERDPEQEMRELLASPSHAVVENEPAEESEDELGVDLLPANDSDDKDEPDEWAVWSSQSDAVAVEDVDQPPAPEPRSEPPPAPPRRRDPRVLDGTEWLSQKSRGQLNGGLPDQF